MDQEAILYPFLGMMLLTAIVWIYMYVRRLSFISGNRIPPQELTTPERASLILPESVRLPANNLRNLLELPVIFYALSLYLYVTGTADAIYVWAAWIFLGLRVIHSANHCTINRVKARFLTYFVSALVLWFMVGRALVDVFRAL